MSPESIEKPVDKIESAPEIAESLRAKYKSEMVDPMSALKIPTLERDDQMMAHCISADEGVDQRLRAVIKAGNEFFCIIDVLAIDQISPGVKPTFMEGTAITRHIPGKENRAQLIDFFGDQMPIHIGRDYSPELKYSPETSGKHLAAIQSESGSVILLDEHSTNGTEVFTPDKDSPNINVVSPVENRNFWSPESALLKASLIKINHQPQG